MKYRPEIDGLRAISVIFVILFHFEVNYFSKGFVGVDIFFVISGYLITSIILIDLSNNNFSIIHFYERRFRRIIPVLIFIILFFIPFSWFWMTPEELIYFSESVLTVIFFVSNLYFASIGDYFDPSVKDMSFLHTWSLSIEEQFYIIFPIFLILINKFFKNKILSIFLIVLIISFLLNEISYKYFYNNNLFYFPHLRVWELLSGSLCAVVLNRYQISGNNVLSFLGIALIFYAVFINENFFILESKLLLVVIGTVLIILFAKNNIISNILSYKFLVLIGLVSYSAYLWHYPIYIFSKIRFESLNHGYLKFFLFFLTFSLSLITWRYIEKPFRKNSLAIRNIFLILLFPFLFIILFSVLSLFTNGYDNRFRDWAKLENIKTVEDSYCHNQGRRNDASLYNGDFCTIGKGEPKMAIIGDSHAGAILNYADYYLKTKNISSVAITGGFCAPLINEFEASHPRCVGEMRDAFKSLSENNQIKDIIMYAGWANYTEGYRGEEEPELWKDKEGKATILEENKFIFERSLIETIKFLNNSNKNIFIVGPSPEFPIFSNNFIKKNMKLKNLSIYEATELLPKIEKNNYLSRNENVFNIFNSIKSDMEFSDIEFIDISDLFCDNDHCFQYENKEKKLPLFSDIDHVNFLGSKLIVKKIFEQLNNN